VAEKIKMIKIKNTIDKKSAAQKMRIRKLEADE
jgi:hypothetical protein